MIEETPEMTKTQTETNVSRHFFREIEIQFLIHEMKDPIAIVETGVRTLLERQDKFGALSAQQERTLKRTLRNVVKAREMLNGLLEVGRSEAGICCADRFDPAPVILQVILDALETHLTPDADAALALDRPDELQQVLGKHGIHLDLSPRVHRIRMCQDETRFRQIVGNLFKNALYHRKQRIDVRADTDGDFLVVAVSDDGAGIDPKHHELVFRQYVQVTDTAGHLPRKGHGLGLAGALIMARSLNGTLRLESEKGQGATFSLRLPITLNPNGPEDAG